MYDVCHPSYYQIFQLGCKDDLKITTAFHVYIDLCEDRKLWDVVYKYETLLDLIYLEAKKNPNAQVEVYVPWPSKNNIKLQDIEQIQQTLNINGFTLVIKSGDGMNIFYAIHEGVSKHLSPQQQKQARLVSEKKSTLNKELRKNSRNLYEVAKLEENQIE